MNLCRDAQVIGSTGIFLKKSRIGKYEQLKRYLLLDQESSKLGMN